MIRYYKLFDLLNRRGMKKTDLLEIISAPTLAKISKGKNIQTDAIDKICLFLGCQPGDIMEVITQEQYSKETGTVIYEKPIIEEYEVDDKIYEFNESEIHDRIVDKEKYDKFIDKVSQPIGEKERTFCQDAEKIKD